MKYIQIIIILLSTSFSIFGQDVSSFTKDEAVRWLNQKLVEGGKKPIVRSDVEMQKRFGTFNDCVYTFSRRTYLQVKDKIQLITHSVTTVDLNLLEPTYLLTIQDGDRVYFSISYSKPLSPIKKTTYDRDERIIKVVNESSFWIGPFENIASDRPKFQTAIRIVFSSCTSSSASNSKIKRDENFQSKINWLNMQIGESAKIPITVEADDTMVESSASLFSGCSYTKFVNTYAVSEKVMGSMGIEKYVVNLKDLDIGTMFQHDEKAGTSFWIRTKRDAKTILTYECDASNNVTQQIESTNFITIGPFRTNSKNLQQINETLVEVITACGKS